MKKSKPLKLRLELEFCKPGSQKFNPISKEVARVDSVLIHLPDNISLRGPVSLRRGQNKADIEEA
jgi:hypothetical protein